MGYRILLLDNDGTLMDFKKAEAQGIENTLRLHGLPFDEEILALYSGINKRCWEEFEQGLMDKDKLLTERFRRFLGQLGNTSVDPNSLRAVYHEELGKGAYLTDGALELCRELGKTHELYIVTNGVSSTQYRRFAISGLDQVVNGIFVSEDIGCPKPQSAYFEHVFAQIPGFRREDALIVGDSLTADIQGGIRAGIDTCWYNPDGLTGPEGLNITYEISDLRYLKFFV